MVHLVGGETVIYQCQHLLLISSTRLCDGVHVFLVNHCDSLNQLRPDHINTRLTLTESNSSTEVVEVKKIDFPATSSQRRHWSSSGVDTMFLILIITYNSIERISASLFMFKPPPEALHEKVILAVVFTYLTKSRRLKSDKFS